MLAPGSSCSLVVVFKPQVAGFVVSSLGVTYGDSSLFSDFAARSIQATGN
jgi:hypothetical protein